MRAETPFEMELRSIDRATSIGFAGGFLAGLLAAAFASLVASPAAAEGQPCYPAADLGAALGRQFGEALIWTGTGEGKVPMMLFVQPGGGTWSIGLLRGDTLCLIAEGYAWQPHSPPAPPPPGEEG